MQQISATIEISTQGPGLFESTADLNRFASSVAVKTDLLTAFCRHISASLLIQEYADSEAKTDLSGFFRRLVPEGMDWIVHRTEGADDMPAHIRSTLTQTPVGIPVIGGKVVLETCPGIFLFEHLTRLPRRQVLPHQDGEWA